ncbi:TetR/AcrR family transcriptional regulator [Marinobacter sp. JSM 1782161]|uniref:TetR/AcrR family transcriptional regulator n=1 Tax=Marinobacter sp. JSM 1782161 TaxID=2685906 RepID=UPI001401CC30|nr:TetR family transcriptional regulator C-terminal domain-containing protein [Marinobacter sp. JSM 1782161]
MTDGKHDPVNAVGGGLRDSIQYQGRKTVRAKSEQRRRQILEAALDIAATDGVREIKHRSVARRAGVPLASTTYYFRDIDELILDAFILFAEKSNQRIRDFYTAMETIIDGEASEERLSAAPGRAGLAEALAQCATRYFATQIRDNRNAILVEKAFLVEAMRDTLLEELARSYRRAWIDSVQALLVRLGASHPRRDAELLVGLVTGLGFDGVLLGRAFDAGWLRALFERMIRMVLDSEFGAPAEIGGDLCVSG